MLVFKFGKFHFGAFLGFLQVWFLHWIVLIIVCVKLFDFAFLSNNGILQGLLNQSKIPVVKIPSFPKVTIVDKAIICLIKSG